MKDPHTFSYVDLDELDIENSPLYGMDDICSEIEMNNLRID